MFWGVYTALRTSMEDTFPKDEEAIEKRRALNLHRCVLSLSLIKDPERVLGQFLSNRRSQLLRLAYVVWWDGS